MNYFYEKERDEADELMITRLNEKNYPPPHFHKQVEIFYAGDDDVDFTLNGNSGTAMRGEVVVYDSYDIHSFNRQRKLTQVIVIPQSMLGRFEKIKDGRMFSENIIKSGERAEHIRRLMDELYNCNDKNSLLAYGIIQTILGEVLEALPLSSMPRPKDNSITLDMLKYISDNYLEDIGLSDIAAHVGYSDHYCSRMFNKMFSMGITEYINMLRVNHADQLIKSGEYDIIEAAMASGFNSVPTFYRNFTKFRKNAPKKASKDEKTE